MDIACILLKKTTICWSLPTQPLESPEFNCAQWVVELYLETLIFEHNVSKIWHGSFKIIIVANF